METNSETKVHFLSYTQTVEEEEMGILPSNNKE
jgi:hypothetical protein